MVNFRYVEPIDQDLKCINCAKPAHNPYLCNDGRLECFDCGKSKLLSHNSGVASKNLIKQLNNLLVVCDNCNDETPVRYLEFGNHKCNFKCKNNGCVEIFQDAKDLEKHVNETCKKQIIDCSSVIKCNWNGTREKLDAHLKSNCKVLKIPTPISSEIKKLDSAPTKSQLYFNYKGRSIFQYSKDNINAEIPDDIESIAIGPGLKESFFIFCCKLPTSVTELFILEGYDYELYGGDMPPHIQKLHLYKLYYNLKVDSIGRGVTTLYLEDGFDQVITTNGIYPENLESLYLYDIVKPFYSKTSFFSFHIKKIYFKDGYSHPIRYETIAYSRSVSFGNIKQPILNGILKATEKDIFFEDGYSHKKRNNFYKT